MVEFPDGGLEENSIGSLLHSGRGQVHRTARWAAAVGCQGPSANRSLLAPAALSTITASSASQGRRCASNWRGATEERLRLLRKIMGRIRYDVRMGPFCITLGSPRRHPPDGDHAARQMSLLFEPTHLGSLTLRNRIVKSATMENMATPDGLPTEDMHAFYQTLARGGAGLIITGYAYVNEVGQSAPLQSGAHTDDVIPKWRRITDTVHDAGAKIALQIAHGGRQTQAKALGGRQPVAPSAIPNLVYFVRPRPMTEEEIWATIRDFGDAAARAKQAGFDGVQIQAAHGYLISGFLSRLTNRRRDDWGGDPERRFRFLAEVYRAVRQAVGTDFPVLCKLNVDDGVWIGLRPRDGFAAARRLADMGLDALEISEGVFETTLRMSRGGAPTDVVGRHRSPLARLYLRIGFGVQQPLTRFKEAYLLLHAKKLKPTLSVPLILVGGIRRPDIAESILDAGHADLISMARPLIREPDLPNRWLVGNRAAALCTSCNRCLAEIEQGNRLQCYLEPVEE